MKRNSRSLRLLCMSLAIALMVSLVGCGQNEAGSSEGQTSNENASEVVSSKDEMVVACYGAVQSMFPGNDSKLPGAQLHVNLYDTLVTMDKDGTILPLLAESWEQLSDTTYRFHIRKGVKFHNGDELKASDVAFSLATRSLHQGGGRLYG